MARTRRRKRSSTQRIAGLVALGLPAPMQRVADSRLGSLMMLIFIPAMIISGVLTVDWKNGTPSLNLNRNKAQELKQKAANEITQWSQDGTLQNWQNNVEKAWQQAQNNISQSGNSNTQGSWLPQHPAWQPKNDRAFPTTGPSTSPGGFVSHSQPQAQQPQTQQPQTSWGNWNTQPQQQMPQNNQPTFTNQPNYGQQPSYGQQGWGQQNTGQAGYNTQQPTYGTPTYNQGSAVPAQGQGNYSYPSATQTNTYQPYYGNSQPTTGSPSGSWLR